MEKSDYKHEIIIPNDNIPVKIFSFSAKNNQRIIPSHWHQSAEILFVRSGKLNIWIKDKKHELGKYDFMYINAAEVHSTQSPEDNEVIVLQIPGNFLESFSNNEDLYIDCNSIGKTDNQEYQKIRSLLQEMYIHNEKKS